MGTHRWLGVGLITLGAGLIVSAILGPLVLGIVDYPLSESLTNQTLGLDAVSLTLVAPVSVLAGALALRGHPAGPVLGFGPAAYGWYMLLQFVVGPEYAYYPGALPLHLGLFVLSGTIAVGSWRAIRSEELPPATRRADRLRGVALLAFSGFLLSRYVPLVADALRGEGLSAEALEGVTMFWSIFLLDLGVVLPATIAAAVGVIAGAPWGRKAMYALVGWWAFVPASVAAMAIVMVGNDDPNASTGQAAVFVVVAVLVLAFAAVVYRGLFRADRVASAPAGEAGRRHLTRVG